MRTDEEKDNTGIVQIKVDLGKKNVTYHRIADVEHTQCWNADPQVYEAELRSFLAQVLDLMVI